MVDFEGISYDPAVIKKLADQISGNIDVKNLYGGAYEISPEGASIGFSYDEAKKLLGTDPTAPQMVTLDMARHLAKMGVTDINQLTPSMVPKDAPYPMLTFGNTYTGEGGTNYVLAFNPETNKPYFYSQGFDTGMSSGDILKALALAGFAIWGLPTLFGAGGVAGTGAAGAGAAGAAGAGLTGAELAIALGEGLVPIASTAGQAAVVGSNLGALGAGIGLGGAGAAGAGLLSGAGSGPGALTGTDAMIAAGEGIVPITAEQVATAGLTKSELAALGSGIGLGDVTTSVLPKLLKDPKNLKSLADLLLSGGGAAMGGGGGGGGAGSVPTQGVPQMTPEYFQAVQNYYNTYLPNTDPNVGSYLSNWYGGTYTG